MKLKSNILLIFFVAALLAACERGTEKTSQYKNITVAEAEKMIEDDDVIIIDVRTDEEFNSGHVPGARQINYNSDNFEEKVSLLDKNKTYILYCRSGNRSSKASEIMSEQGFKKVHNMEGGMKQWESENLPVEE